MMALLLKIMRGLVFVGCFFTASHTAASTQFFWQSAFSQNEKQRLTRWITHAEHGVNVLFGPLPYAYSIYFYRQPGVEPVPWAQTQKGAKKSAHFYVDTQYSQQAFIADWTAPHELAHLLFPYIGRSSSWFSEGIASYLQYQIMYANKVITWQHAVNKLEERYRAARAYKQHDASSIMALSKTFHRFGAHVRLYWGGASYFNHVDKRLFEQKGLRLNDVIRHYLACCAARKIPNAKQMILLFDQLSDSQIFSQTMQQTVYLKGFPKTKSATRWLRKNPPKLGSNQS